MDQENVEQMWNIMKENNFEVNDDINSDYLCIICIKILIDACSAPCGCRYCKQCIKEYLNEEPKLCPGTFEYCKNKVIDIDRDIHIDQAINIKISKLEVKCPNEFCQSKVELKTMKNHLEICEKRSFQCLYFNLGCTEEKIVKDKSGEHLLSEIQPHTKLLMEWITNSQSDSESLKKEMEHLRLIEEGTHNRDRYMERIKSENGEIKEKMGKSENIIGHLQKIEKENTTEINNLGEEMSALKNDNRSLKEELRTVKNQITKNNSSLELITKMENQDKEIDQLNHEIKAVRKENVLLKGEIQELRNKEISDFNTQIGKLGEDVDQLKQQNKEIDKLRQEIREIGQLKQQINKFEKQSKEIVQLKQQINNLKQQHEEIDQVKQRFGDKFENFQSTDMEFDKISLANSDIEIESKKTRKPIEIMPEIIGKSNYEEFIWKINDWSKKRRKAQNGIDERIYSQNFFSQRNQLNIRFSLDLNGIGSGEGVYLGLYCFVKRDLLPDKYHLEFSLINQRSGLSHLTIRYRDMGEISVSFITSTDEHTYGLGKSQFIKLEEISTNSALSQNNRIIMKCALKPV